MAWTLHVFIPPLPPYTYYFLIMYTMFILPLPPLYLDLFPWTSPYILLSFPIMSLVSIMSSCYFLHLNTDDILFWHPYLIWKNHGPLSPISFVVLLLLLLCIDMDHCQLSCYNGWFSCTSRTHHLGTITKQP
jgi:hypothetical protein